MDVGDFLELEGAFQGDREKGEAAKKQEVVVLGITPVSGFDARDPARP
jgi:hypothetical protein